ncbi:MAG: aspartate/glutamate racemase family protein [Shimia sp.]
MRTIGVLGGMGPEATVLFQARMIAAVAAGDDADHIPLLVDMNPQVPSRIAHLIEGLGPDPAPVLAAMAERVEAAGASALAMPCNTAHHYADAIRAAARIPLIDMVALSAARCQGHTGLLASPAMRRAGVWDAYLPETLWPEDEDAMLTAIRAVKRGDPTAARAPLAAAAEELQAKGAETLLIACSEFSTIAEAVPDALDTLDVLVEACVAFAKGEDA